MNKKERMIIMLKDAVRDFKLEPDYDIQNESGLCWYFEMHELNQDQYKISLEESILGEYYSALSYSFCDGWSQEDLYDEGLEDYYYERAKWCEQRLKELEELVIYRMVEL